MNSKPRKISFDIPSYIDLLPHLKKSDLTSTEQKLYLHLSFEFQLELDSAPTFQLGAQEWCQKLPNKLQKYGLNVEEWERISTVGDNCDAIQSQLDELLTKIDAIRNNVIHNLT